MLSRWMRRPKSKFSLENLKYLHEELTRNARISAKNQEHVIEALRTVAEVLIWGDQHDEPALFDFFAEKNMLRFFLGIVKQKECGTRVKTQVIQTLSILIQNTTSEQSLFYLFSNNVVNDLIVYRFDFSDEELLAHYVSFLKCLSLKLNERTIQFFFNERANDFPLYTEALHFFNHPEAMVRTAVRTLTLRIYRVNYAELRRFVLDQSAVPYFTNLVWFCRDEVLQLDQLLGTTTFANRAVLEEKMESLTDLLYYLQDILSLDHEALSQVLIDQMLAHFVLPVLIGSIADSKTISRHLALFLLSQLFLTFTHYAFVNSVVTALVDKNPPVLAAQLITSPPQCPVKAPVPITHILFPKATVTGAPPSPSIFNQAASAQRKRPSSDDDDDNEKNHAAPPHHRRGESAHEAKDGGGVRANGDDAESGDGGGHDDNDDDDASSSHTGSSEPKSGRMELPPDENLKARGTLPDVGPVASPIQAHSNYLERAESNIYRDTLLDYMRGPSEDERLVFLSTAVLLTIVRNEKTDKEVLHAADLCPQRFSAELRLLHELTSVSETSDVADDDHGARGNADEAPRQQPPDAVVKKEEEEAAPTAATAAAGAGGAAETSAAAGRMSPALPQKTASVSMNSEGDPDPLMQTRTRRFESKTHVDQPHHFHQSRPSELVLRDGHVRSLSAAQEKKLQYPRELVEVALKLLLRRPPYRLCTVQLLTDTLVDAAFDKVPGPCLAEAHDEQLDLACEQAGVALRGKLTGAMSNVILDMIEDEWNALDRTPVLRDLVSNALSLLELTDRADKGVPMAYRHPATDLEHTRKTIQIFLLLRRVRCKLLKVVDPVFPLGGREKKVERGQSWPMDGADIIPCTIASNKKKKRVNLIIHDRHMLIGERKPADANATLEVAIPLRHQEPYVDRSNNSVLHTTVRSPRQPHPSAVMLKGTRLRPLWTFTMYFPDKVQCAAAQRFLESRRAALRQELVEELGNLLPTSKEGDEEEKEEEKEDRVVEDEEDKEDGEEPEEDGEEQ